MLPITRRLILWLVAVSPTVLCGRSSPAEEFLPQLTAFDLASDQIHPGEVINARYEFVNLGTAPADGDYTVFVHIRPAIAGDPDVGPATGADFRPLTPAFAWLPRTVVREDGHPIGIPNDFPPGRYNVLIGLYEQGTGQGRLIINYSWGNQQGIEHLAEAVHEGTEEQFLRGWFPPR